MDKLAGEDACLLLSCFWLYPSWTGNRICIGLDVQQGVQVETMLCMGEPTAPEDFDAKSQSTEVAPRGTEAFPYLYMAKTPIG